MLLILNSISTVPQWSHPQSLQTRTNT